MASWVPVVVSIVAAAAAVVSAILAGRWAYRTKQAEIEATRVLELERRLAASKSDVFVPMIEAIGEGLALAAAGKSSDQAALDKVAGEPMRRFVHWVQVYGSDETVRVVHRMMQATYHDAPPEIVLRLMAELILATRREIGHPDTEISVLDLLGLRITDTYINGQPPSYMTKPEHKLYAELGWKPPWGDRFDPSESAASQTSWV